MRKSASVILRKVRLFGTTQAHPPSVKIQSLEILTFSALPRSGINLETPMPAPSTSSHQQIQLFHDDCKIIVQKFSRW